MQALEIVNAEFVAGQAMAIAVQDAELVYLDADTDADNGLRAPRRYVREFFLGMSQNYIVEFNI